MAYTLHVMARKNSAKSTSLSGDASSPEVDIAGILKNQDLASAITQSIERALKSEAVHVDSDGSVSNVFKLSLDAAIRDIADHPQGQLIQRLILHGTPDPDDPELLVSDGQTILSDPECMMCVNFIHSNMINRFKGELAARRFHSWPLGGSTAGR